MDIHQSKESLQDPWGKWDETVDPVAELRDGQHSVTVSVKTPEQKVWGIASLFNDCSNLLNYGYYFG